MTRSAWKRISAPVAVHIAAIAALFVALAPVARAQAVKGVYVDAAAGINLLEDEMMHSSAGLAPPGLRGHFDPGALGTLGLGYAFGNGYRVELEGSYRDNALRTLTGTALPGSASGSQQQVGLMANGAFDMDIGVPWLYPYLGAGVGYVWDRLEGVQVTGNGNALSASGTDGSFAWQAMIGAALPIPHTPGLSATVEYRYLGVSETRTYQAQGNGGVAGTLDLRGPSGDHSLMLGLRYVFDVAPPPPSSAASAPAVPQQASVPAPATRSYLVFFDWDQASLSARARQIVATAAEAAKSATLTRILVEGYTDRSGSPAYNLRLSRRRAQAVAAELVRRGVAETEITVRGLGEADPLVPTAAGVREARNRRVEIIFK